MLETCWRTTRLLAWLNVKALSAGQWPVAEHRRQGTDIVFEQSTCGDGVHQARQWQGLCFAHTAHDVARCEIVRGFEARGFHEFLQSF